MGAGLASQRSQRDGSNTCNDSQFLCGSVANSVEATRKTNIDPLVVEIMMPLYYSSEPMLASELVTAKLSWDKVLYDLSPEWIVKKKELSHKSCRQWFHVAFYNRLFDIHPVGSPSKHSFIIQIVVFN